MLPDWEAPVTNLSPVRTGRPAWSAFFWLGLAILACAGAWLLIAAWQEGLSGGRDFVQDYAAVVKIGEGRNPYEPYNDVTQALFGGPPHRTPLYSFHAPSSLPLLIWLLPFATLGGYTGAFLAWGAVSLLALWAICWLTLRVLGMPRPILAGLLSALALMTLPAIRESFEEGQLNVVVAAGMVGCWAMRRVGRSGLAGVLLGIGFALKPIPGLFFVYYAWRRDWRLLVSAAATVLVLSVAGLGLSGIEGARLWATVNYPSHAGVWPGYPDNASVRGFYTRIFGPSDWRPRPPWPLPYASTLLWAASGAVLTVTAIVVARSGIRRRHTHAPPSLLDRATLGLLSPPPLARDDPRGDLEVAVLTVLTLLVTPIVWPHYYVVLVMPVAVTATYLARLILDSSARIPADEPADGGGSADGVAGRAAASDARRRILPALALALVIGATIPLAFSQYVEPFARVGGQNLLALLALFAGSLCALGWSARTLESGAATPPAPDSLAEAQGRGVSPAASR